MGQARKGGGGVLGTGHVKKGGLRHGSGSKKGGGLYCGTYVYWTYMRVPTPRAWTIMIIFYIKPLSEWYQDHIYI